MNEGGERREKEEEEEEEEGKDECDHREARDDATLPYLARDLPILGSLHLPTYFFALNNNQYLLCLVSVLT